MLDAQAPERFGKSGSGIYTLEVKNATHAAPTNGMLTVAELLPGKLSLVSMVGDGWSCNGTNCTRSDALAAGFS